MHFFVVTPYANTINTYNDPSMHVLYMGAEERRSRVMNDSNMVLAGLKPL